MCGFRLAGHIWVVPFEVGITEFSVDTLSSVPPVHTLSSVTHYRQCHLYIIVSATCTCIISVPHVHTIIVSATSSDIIVSATSTHNIISTTSATAAYSAVSIIFACQSQRHLSSLWYHLYHWLLELLDPPISLPSVSQWPTHLPGQLLLQAVWRFTSYKWTNRRKLLKAIRETTFWPTMYYIV